MTTGTYPPALRNTDQYAPYICTSNFRWQMYHETHEFDARNTESQVGRLGKYSVHDALLVRKLRTGTSHCR